MKRLTALMLVLCLILCGCGSDSSEETSEPTAESTEETVDETVDETVEETVEETDPPIVYINPLTGVEVDGEFTARPIAIMINNHKVALPHHGVSAADMVYECCVEGGMTRFMLIFTDPASAGPIGAVRSCRPPFVDIVQGYDAIYSSAGGDGSVLKQIDAGDVDYINGLSSKYFYRNKDRLNKVAYEHTLFIKGADLLQLAKDKGYRTTAEAGKDYGMTFTDEAIVNGETANTATIYFTKNGKTTTATYDGALGGYTLNQYGINYVDGNTGEKVVFRNVLVLNAERSIASNGVHVLMDTVGTGTGYLLRDGKIQPIKWSRSDVDSPFSYTYADGSPALFGVGRTYVAVKATTAGFDYK